MLIYTLFILIEIKLAINIAKMFATAIIRLGCNLGRGCRLAGLADAIKIYKVLNYLQGWGLGSESRGDGRDKEKIYWVKSFETLYRTVNVNGEDCWVKTIF